MLLSMCNSYRMSQTKHELLEDAKQTNPQE